MKAADLGAYRIGEHPLLPRLADGEIVRFSFDGRELHGIAGEPIAAALLAHGIRVFRTMPETGEPRGLFSGIGRSLDGLMQVDDIPNVSVSITPLVAGMQVRTQHALGSWDTS
jgi:hypothetical protein